MDTTLLGGKVIFLEKGGKKRKVYTTRGNSVCFGKALSCHFRLQNPNAKAVHCKIAIGKFGKVKIVNYSEEHPITVNDRVVRKKQCLKSGDLVDIFGLHFLWEYSPVLLETPRRHSNRPTDKRRVWMSEPGRKKKFMRLDKEAIVSILTPLRKKRSFTGFTKGTITSPEVEIVSNVLPIPGDVPLPKTPEEAPPASRISVNLMNFQTPGPSCDILPCETPNLMDSTLVATTSEITQSLYGTPEGPSLETTRASPEPAPKTPDMIDWNTPAATKVQTVKEIVESETEDFFKTPMKQILPTRGRTPSSVRTNVKMEFTDLPQSTPIDATKCVDEESTIIDVDQSESIIMIDDSSEVTPESVKYIGNTSKIGDATPQRTLRSATKPTVASATIPRTPKTPRTPRNIKTPKSVAKVQDVTPKSSRIPKSVKKSTKTPQSVKEPTTPKNVKGITKRAATSARKPRGRGIQAKLNTSDTTGEKVQPTVSQLRGLMTMENLANITTDATEKENITTPLSQTSHRTSELSLLLPKNTPDAALSPKEVNLSAIKSTKVDNTPRSPLQMLSNKASVKILFGAQTNVTYSPYNDLTNVDGVRRLFRTPGKGKKDDLTDVVGVRELLATPKYGNELEDIVGVRELMKTPHEDVTMDLRGVRDLMRELPDESIKLSGVRDLMKSPVDGDITVDLRGVKDMMKEVKDADMSLNLVGIKEIMMEPKEGDTTINYMGIKELVKETAADKTINYAGLRDLMKPSTSKDTSFSMIGVKELLQETETNEMSHNLAGALDPLPEETDVVPQTAEPDASKQTSSASSVVEVIDLDVTPDELFDSLKGVTSIPSVQRTYSRKSSPKKSLEPQKDDKGIQEWIDSIVLSTTNENTQSRRANNTQQVLSDKYSNVTATESEQLLADSTADVEEAEDVPSEMPAVRKDTSLRKLAIAQSIAEHEKNLQSANDTFDFGHKVSSTPKVPRIHVEAPTPSSSPRRSGRNASRIETPEVHVTSAKKNDAAPAEAAVKLSPEKKRKVTFEIPESPTIEDVTTTKSPNNADTLSEEVPTPSVQDTNVEILESPVRTNRAENAAITDEVQKNQPEERKVVIEEVNLDMEDVVVESAMPAVMDQNQSEVNAVVQSPATPAKRGRKAKKIQEDTEEKVAEIPSNTAAPKHGRRAPVVKNLEQYTEGDTTADTSVNSVRTKRGRKPAIKQQEETELKTENPVEENAPTPVKRGRKAVVAKESQQDTEVTIPDTSANSVPAKRGRKVTTKKQKEIEQNTENNVEENAPTPVKRGRKAATKKENDSENLVEETPTSVRRGRKALVVKNQMESEEDIDDVVKDSPVVPAKRGRKAATKKGKEPEQDTENPVEEIAASAKRGRKASAKAQKESEQNTDEAVTESPVPAKRGRKAPVTKNQKEVVQDIVEAVTESPAAPAKRERKAPAKKQQKETELNTDEAVTESPAVPAKRGRKAPAKKQQKETELTTDEAVNESPAIPAKRERKAPAKKQQKETELNTDEAVTESPAVPAKRGRKAPAKKQQKETELTTEDTNEDSLSVPTKRGRKAAAKGQKEPEHNTESDTDSSVTTAKRGRKRGIAATDQDNKDIAESSAKSTRTKRGHKAAEKHEDLEETEDVAVVESSTTSIPAKRGRKTAKKIIQEADVSSTIPSRAKRGRKANEQIKEPTVETESSSQEQETAKSDEEANVKSSARTKRKAAKKDERQEPSNTPDEASEAPVQAKRTRRAAKNDVVTSTDSASNASVVVDKKVLPKKTKKVADKMSENEIKTPTTRGRNTKKSVEESVEGTPGSSQSKESQEVFVEEPKPRARRGRKPTVDTSDVLELPKRNLRTRKATQ